MNYDILCFSILTFQPKIGSILTNGKKFALLVKSVFSRDASFSPRTVRLTDGTVETAQNFQAFWELFWKPTVLNTNISRSGRYGLFIYWCQCSIGCCQSAHSKPLITKSYYLVRRDEISMTQFPSGLVAASEPLIFKPQNKVWLFSTSLSNLQVWS